MDHLPAEIKERVAKLNTQLRFGRIRPALNEAYKLRTYLQLKGAQREVEALELARVEKIISTLESYHTTGIQKLVRSLIDIVAASLTPEVDNSESLLDKFNPPKKEIKLEEPTQPVPEDEGSLFPEDISDSTGEEEPAAETEAKPPTKVDKNDEVDWGWGPLS